MSYRNLTRREALIGGVAALGVSGCFPFAARHVAAETVAASRNEVSLIEGKPATFPLAAGRPATWSMLDDGGSGAVIDAAGELSIPPQVYYRSPLLYPFNTASIWNVPIGDGAEYQRWAFDNETGSIRSSAPLPRREKNSAYSWLLRDSMSVFRTSPGDPLAQWTYQKRPKDLPWPFPDDPGRFDRAGTFTLRTPDSFEGRTVDGWAILIDEEGRSYYETFHPKVTRDGSGRIAKVDCRFIARNDLYGTGFPNNPKRDDHQGIRAPGISLLGGLVRTEELRAGRIPHAIAMVISDYQLKEGSSKSQQIVWPAYHPDNHSLKLYKGVIPMGAMFAIPWDVNLDTLGLKTPEGKMLARAYQEFGGYVVDCAIKTCAIACLEAGMPESMFKGLRTDLAAIRGALSFVSNNAASAKAAGKAAGLPAPQPVGGGGRPRIAPPRHVVDETTMNPRRIRTQAVSANGEETTVTVDLAIEEADRTPPVLRSAGTITIRENCRLGHPVYADKPVSVAVTGGADAKEFRAEDAGINGWFLQFAGQPTRAGKQLYAVEITATDAAGNATQQAITVNVEPGNPDGNLLRPAFDAGENSWTLTDVTDPAAMSFRDGTITFTADGTASRRAGCARQRIAVNPGTRYNFAVETASVGVKASAASVQISTGPNSHGVKPLETANGKGRFDISFVPTAPYVWVKLVFSAYEAPERSGSVAWSALSVREVGA